MVLTAFVVGEPATDFDLPIVDETHRPNRRHILSDTRPTDSRAMSPARR
jgi:hypothetical protein